LLCHARYLGRKKKQGPEEALDTNDPGPW
jgi:hypothetical protein